MKQPSTTQAKRKDEYESLQKLNGSERRWAAYQPWLKTLGYNLRPRYQPGWSPSWLTSGISALYSEDALLPNLYGKVMDATRTSDGRVVAMKLLPTDRKELSIWSYLSSTPLKDDPRNHSVPLLGVHPLPDTDDEVLAVMPLLVYFHRPPFETLGELLLCIHTYLEGLAFLHEHRITHLSVFTSLVSNPQLFKQHLSDICTANMLQDPGKTLYPLGFHPARPAYYAPNPKSPEVAIAPPYTCRTLAPVKYYLIDFGESIQYDSLDDKPQMEGEVGHILDVPEFAENEPYDPFKLDIRTLGETIKSQLCEEYFGLDALTPLLDAMRRDQPEERPTASEALKMLRNIIEEQSALSLAGFINPRQDYLQEEMAREYRRHRLEIQLKSRPPIYPEIPGLKVKTPKPLNLVSKTLIRLRLLFSSS